VTRAAWPRVNLAEVLERRPPDVIVDPTGTYPFAGVYCFGRGVFRSQERQGSEFSYGRLTQLRAGNFVYPKLMAWEGAFGVVPDTCDGCYVSPEFPVFHVRSDRLMSRFLGYYFQIASVWETTAGGSIGTNVRRRRLHPDDLLRRAIPLPPLPEQQRIVAKLDEIFGRLEHVTALRQSAVEDTNRLATNMAHRADLSDAERARLGWRPVRLAEVIQLATDRHRVEIAQKYENLGIYSFGRGLFRKESLEGALTSAPFLHRVKKGQFIYSRLFAFEGAYGMVTEEFDGFFVSQEYPTFECRQDSIRVEFLWAYFSSPGVWKEVAAGSKGLGDRRQRVQPPQVLNHELWLPPLGWQGRVAEMLAHSARLDREYAAAAAEMGALKPAILDRAFTGTL
jgi:type I restriction enzyme, S subunit